MNTLQQPSQPSNVSEAGRLRYVFLASSPFSGSTLLSFLLGSHNGIATTSAVAGTRREHIMERFACSCGERMVECDFWREVEQRMHARGYEEFELSNFQLHFEPKSPLVERLHGLAAGTPGQALLDRVSSTNQTIRENQAITKRTADFAETVLALTGASVFIDATKQPTRLRYLTKYLEADFRVIHLVRDVRGNVNSRLRHRNYKISVRQAAQQWQRENRLILQHLKRLPANKQMMVTYEALCTDTDETLQQLFTFCGVDASVVIQDYLAAPQHLLGNQMRMRSSSDIELDQRWQESLSKPDLDTIEAVTQGFAQQLYTAQA